MLQELYAKFGFEITKFGANSKVLRFNHKPVFVFNSETNLDSEFLKSICDTYLKISEKRRSPISIKVD